VTTRPGRQARERLADILEAVARTKRAEDQLVRAEQDGATDATRVALDAILYNLVVMGEAVNALSPELTDTEPDVP